MAVLAEPVVEPGAAVLRDRVVIVSPACGVDLPGAYVAVPPAVALHLRGSGGVGDVAGQGERLAGRQESDEGRLEELEGKHPHDFWVGVAGSSGAGSKL